MNKDIIAGNWKQLVGKAKVQWGKLTDDDLALIEGRQDQLVGRIQERYGIAREEAERQVKENGATAFDHGRRGGYRRGAGATRAPLSRWG